MKEKSVSNDILDMEGEFEATALRDRVGKLEKEIIRLHRILKENDVELEGLPDMSDEEYICISQIKKLKDLSDSVTFSQEDAKVLDILHKNLKLARGEVTMEGRKKKKLSTKELLKIVDSGSETFS